jgi:aminopeptidase N
MKTDSAPTIFLKDYTPPAFLVDSVALDVDFQSDATIITARLAVRRNAAATAIDPGAALILDGNELETLSVAIDDVILATDRFVISEATLAIADVPNAFELRTVVRIRPDKNTRLSGMYRSADGYFTQCEAEGFRRITWFADRPDVMSRYTVTIHADRELLPVLLSNGNPIASGNEAAGRHWARWEDPFPKPCYLFALVAARLESLHDSEVTGSGRTVHLAIYVEPGKLDQCDHAMAALKKSMRWDEQTFGLECDLDHYMIVAVGDFNMGAMENKGLNIFNTKYVLARPDVATDTDYENIDRVVGHEYFHNWTGNRVTCRDWFQLSLKEGLTVFRDQEFGADIHSRAVTRVRDVRNLRAAQFPEDAGPMAHPVRPSSYVEINNFYTATVYEKGAEVVRMIRTLIGKDAFRRGMDLYFQRHDGEAVTCDDFVAAMADASDTDFTQFMRWYDQAGTPHLGAQGHYDAAARRYVLTLTQSPAPLPGALAAQPFHIPVAVGLLGPDGTDMPLRLSDDSVAANLVMNVATTRILSLVEPEQQFVFEDVPSPPVPSLLRGFSAPVVLEFPCSDADLAHLLAHDSDPFGRWEAGQMLAGRLILDGAKRIAEGSPPQSMQWPASFAHATQRVIESAGSDPAFAAEVLSLPTEATLAEQMPVVDPEALHAARNGLRRFVAEQLTPLFHDCYRRFAADGPYRPDPEANGQRALRNTCLAYLNETESAEARALAVRQFESADNMTDQFAALAVLAQYDIGERTAALAAFHARWQHEALVIDKWLAVQAGSRRNGTLDDVMQLLDHPSFDLRNPNKVYSLLRTFGNNHVRFHAADGAGYRFIAQQTQRLDAINPQVAARLARCFDRWRKFDPARQAHARAALEQLRQHHGLSRDVLEIVERALQ